MRNLYAFLAFILALICLYLMYSTGNASMDTCLAEHSESTCIHTLNR